MSDRNRANEVVIAGIAAIPLGEYWEESLHTLAVRALRAAMRDAGEMLVGAVYVGNALASILSHQSNLGSLITTHAGMVGTEAYTVEAAGASGAGAARMGYLAVASGYVDAALVVGVEKFTDATETTARAAASQMADYDYEAVQGITPTNQAALLARRYLYQYHLPETALGIFSTIACNHARGNPNAFRQVDFECSDSEFSEGFNQAYLNLGMAPYVDGAAALLLTRADLLPVGYAHPLVRVSGSSVVIDSLALHDREDPLAFQAAGFSVEQALRRAGILPSQVDFFELCDAFSVYAALSLEAAGFCGKGEAVQMAQEGGLALNGKLPVSTLGGLFGRGNPLGAAGVYQLAEAVQQLRGTAGENQVAGARCGLVQSLGGPASTAISFVLERIS